jgi:hypothetical protein
VLVQYHLADAYMLPWSTQRWNDYGDPLTPTAVFNGIDPVSGAVDDNDQQYTIYRTNHFLPNRGLPTDVTVAVEATEVAARTYDVAITVGIEADGAPHTMTVFLVQVIDHWPAVPDYSRAGFRQGFELDQIQLAPGGTTTVHQTLVLDDESWADQASVRLVAWAQDATAPGPGEVFQAAVRDWPLAPPLGDDDGDGIADGIDVCPHRADPLQLDGDEDGVGDACDVCPGDPRPTPARRGRGWPGRRLRSVPGAPPRRSHRQRWRRSGRSVRRLSHDNFAGRNRHRRPQSRRSGPGL